VDPASLYDSTTLLHLQCNGVVWVEDSKFKGSNTNDVLIYYSQVHTGRQDDRQDNTHTHSKHN